MKTFERFKLANRKAGNVSFYEKDALLDDIQPVKASVYYNTKVSMWYIRLTDENGDSVNIGLMEGCKPDAAAQKAIDAANKAAGVLKLNPADKAAQKELAKHEAAVTGFVTTAFDSEDNFLYGGETEKGYWLRLSPNAPGTTTPVAEFRFEAVGI